MTTPKTRIYRNRTLPQFKGEEFEDSLSRFIGTAGIFNWRYSHRALLRLLGKAEREGRALFQAALHPDLPAVALDDVFDDGKTKACSSHFP